MDYERESFWGKPTASLDWCEVNYAYSPYVAEFWNTISSMWLAVIAVFGLIQGQKLRISLSVQMSYLVLGVVGVGSALFHATLLYSAQLLDELPMIYGTLIFLYCIWDFEKDSPIEKFFVPLLVLTGVTITVVMLTHSDNPNFHQFAYAALVFLLIFRAYHIAYRSNISASEKAIFNFFFVYSFCVFGSGYISWITERKLCANGYVIPWIQLHSLWHLLTGTGTFGLVQFLTYYRLNDRTTDVEIQYLLGVIPYLAKRNKKQF
jgi:dihydroceramidase